MKTDEELVAAAMAGGPEAFAFIVERYQDAVFGVALARVGDFHAAEDIAQDVFVVAFERLATLKNPARLGAWLRSVAIHRSIDFLRSRRETIGVEERGMPPADEHGPPAQVARRELREAVLAAIGRLSKTQRETTTLFYVNGYSVAEVAAMQEVPVGTVKYRLHDAREKLKEDMIGMVENVLKSEAPKEDLAQRVFEVLSQQGRHEHEIMLELRRIGSGGGIEGLRRALESPRSETRGRALAFVSWFDAPENLERIIELLQRALQDSNSGVRGLAIHVALEDFSCSDERKRREFVPRVVELLFDGAIPVRRMAARQLLGAWPRGKPLGAGEPGWAAEVPLERAARALVDETDPIARQSKAELLRAVLARSEDRRAPDWCVEVEERLSRLRAELKSPSSSVRKAAISHLLELRTRDDRKRQDVLPLVVAALRDRSRRVRWRAAYELRAWAGDVPIDVVEKACRAETHAGTRTTMRGLLRMATKEQGKTDSG